MKLAIEKITPGLANRMLANNESNRRVRPGVVAKYARDMREGNWQLTGDPIRLNCDGRLLDGQHRLLAVVQSGKTIQSAVARQVDEGVHAVIDSGATRSLANVLAWKGETHAAGLGAAVNWNLRYEAGMMRDPSWRSSHADALRWLDLNPNIRDSVKLGFSLRAGLPLAVSMSAGVHYQLGRVDSIESADIFFDALRDGSNLEVGSPILVVRRWFTRAYARRDKPSQIVSAAVLIKAVNCWLNGEIIQHIGWRANGPQAEEFPTIQLPA